MWNTVRAWEGSARAARCRHCRRRIVWVLTDENKSVPFDVGFTIREIVRHPETLATFLVLHRDDSHDCVEGRLARRGHFANNGSRWRFANNRSQWRRNR